eukprot:CAMPEP_0172911678 /NCGR_PEP_ID=MMETSP1075-20121228/187011_1 /TAXON_ID=2916 /ORGANISM="Ceratium fusus, Strain PA161109" /LENGTH=72 /DNA_ID=CAMNT_0013770045 /DNA_START=8 /DNA_END=223 /DNA_ORIENTATION=-
MSAASLAPAAEVGGSQNSVGPVAGDRQGQATITGLDTAGPSSNNRLPVVHNSSVMCLGRLVSFHVTLLDGSA